MGKTEMVEAMRASDSDEWPARGSDAGRRLSSLYERGFSTDLPWTVGLEEELILVDAASLLPVDMVESVLGWLAGDDRFKPEFRASQLELRTNVCLTVGDASRELVSARMHALARIDRRLRLLAVGTHPTSTVPSAVTARERFRRIAEECGWAVRRGQPSGLHIHVAVGDPGEALAVYNAARSYLPELAALAANSAFFEGRPSGLASTRLKLTEDLPRAGIPPAFSSWRSLAEFVTWASRGGVFPDLSYLWWDLRPRPDYGTLELRIADVQTLPADTAAVAAVWQSLVVALADRYRRGASLPVYETQMLSENRWRAVRDGLDAKLVDLETGAAIPARDRIATLLGELEPYADELGCAEQFAHARTLQTENGALRQRAVAARQGVRGLLEWLADESEPRSLFNENSGPAPESAVSSPALAAASPS